MNERLTLVIDQDRACNRDLAAALRADGHLVASAHGIGEALHAISHLQPNGAVLDLDLGELSGLVLIPLLRQANAACRIIVRSAYYGAGDDRNAADLGACAIIAKTEGHAAVLAMLRPQAEPTSRPSVARAMNGELRSAHRPDFPWHAGSGPMQAHRQQSAA